MGKVLIVDDDQSVVFMLAEVLRDAGHEPVHTLSADQVLPLLEGVDAALVDLHMPGEDGLALTQRIHQYDASLPVILLTGDSREQVRRQAATAFDVMTKPLDIDNLTAVLGRALSAPRLKARR